MEIDTLIKQIKIKLTQINEFEKRYRDGFLGLLVISVILWLFIGFGIKKYRERKLETYYRITIGTILEINPGWHSTCYYYLVNNEKYTIEDRKPGKDWNCIKTHKRFFIRYIPDSPYFSRIFSDKPAPDWLEAPPNGWAEIPKLDMKNKRVIDEKNR